MKFNDRRVSTKLWCGVFGLLLLTLAVTAWSQYRATVLADAAMEQVRAYEHRIATAIEWRGATETVGDRVLASNASADTALGALFDARVKSGVAAISGIQSKVVAEATSDADKAALQKVADERVAVLALNKQARELKTASASAAVPADFVEKTYLPAIGRYVGALDAFVKVQERQRDAAMQALQSSRRQALAMTLGTMALLLVAGAVLVALLVRAMTQPLAHAVRLAESIAAGDLTAPPQPARRDEFGQLLQALDTMVQRLRGVVGEVRSGVESVSTASAEIAHGNQDLSARTEQAASSLQQTAASMEQLTSTVSQSTDTAHQARQLAGTAAQAATRGGEVMAEVVSSMEQISGSSRRIGDIIGTIDGIAFQTNILALNAAVEAARAGEQGRGFAVVASEVRSLAQRSAQAAREIKTLIGASVETVEVGSRQVAQAGQTMGEIVQGVRQVSDLIAEIHAASSEQRDGIGQVNQAVGHLDQMTQQNAALVEESAAAASSLRDQAQRLTDAISVFKLGGPAASAPTAPIAHIAAPAPRMAAPAAIRAARPVAVAAPARTAAVPKPATAPRIASGRPAAKAGPAPAASAAPVREKVAAADNDDWESF
ncbi:methyl-accepting chemotaxis protein [Sphingomonas sp. NCPPB 2930]